MQQHHYTEFAEYGIALPPRDTFEFADHWSSNEAEQQQNTPINLDALED